MLLSPSLSPQIPSPSVASDPQISCTSPALAALLIHSVQNLCLSAVRGPSRPPTSFSESPISPYSPIPPILLTPASPTLWASSPLSPTPGASPPPPTSRTFSGFLSPKFLQRAPPRHSSGIPPTPSSLRQAFPFILYGLPYPQGPHSPCSENALSLIHI